MTSPRRRQDRPIESVALKITFRADKQTAARIKEVIPSVVVHKGVCVIRIEAEEPAVVADKAKILLEKIRRVV